MTDSYNVSHALFGVVWTKLEDRETVNGTLDNIRKFVHDRVSFWKWDMPISENNLKFEERQTEIIKTMEKIAKSSYGRLCTVYALLACRMGIMIINANRILLPTVLAPVTHNPATVSRWCHGPGIGCWSDLYQLGAMEMSNNGIVHVTDLPMKDKLYPANDKDGTDSIAVSTTFRSIHYESAATLAEQALVELYVHIMLTANTQTTLGYELTDILEQSSDHNVERRVFRWYAQFVPPHGPLAEQTFRAVLNNQARTCLRKNPTAIEGGRTPGVRRPRSPPAPQRVVPLTPTDDECMTDVFFDTPAAVVKELWKMDRLQYSMKINALKKIQRGQWDGPPDTDRVERAMGWYDGLLSQVSWVIAEVDAEEHICQATMQLVTEWMDAVTHHTIRSSPTQRMIVCPTNMFQNFTGLMPRDKKKDTHRAEQGHIGLTLGSCLSSAVHGVVPVDLAEKLCNFVALQAMTWYRTGHLFPSGKR